MEYLIALNLAVLMVFLIGTASAKITDFVYGNELHPKRDKFIGLSKMQFLALSFYVQTQIIGALFIYLAN